MTTAPLASPLTLNDSGPKAKPGWRYVGSGRRDLRLDLVRGYAVFGMIVDHVGGDSPSRLYALTGGDQFFMSAAEAFVFISGVTVGMVYGDRAVALGWRPTALKLVARAWTLYVLAVGLTIAIATVDTLLGSPESTLVESPGRFILEIVTLRRTYYLLDVMLLYALLMLAAPAALAVLLHGRWWLVLAASWCLWAAYQVWPGQLQLPWPITNNDVFHVAAWQVLFFTGLVLGFKRDAVRRWLGWGWRASLGTPVLVILLLLLVALVRLQQTNGAMFDALGPWARKTDLLDTWFDKGSLPPGRLAACAITFAIGWMLVTRYWRPLQVVLGRALLPLGQAALYAYAVHVLLVSGIAATEQWVWGPDPVLRGSINVAVQLGAVLVVWVVARRRFLQPVFSSLGKLPLRQVRRRDGTLSLVPTRGLGSLLGLVFLGVILVLVRG